MKSLIKYATLCSYMLVPFSVEKREASNGVLERAAGALPEVGRHGVQGAPRQQEDDYYYPKYISLGS